MSADDAALVCAYQLDGDGGARQLTLADLETHRREDGPVWLHFDRAAGGTENWLRTSSGLSALAIETLLAEETRPRCEAFDDGLIVLLRGGRIALLRHDDARLLVEWGVRHLGQAKAGALQEGAREAVIISLSHAHQAALRPEHEADQQHRCHGGNGDDDEEGDTTHDAAPSASQRTTEPR